MISACSRSCPHEDDITKLPVTIEFDYSHTGISHTGTSIIFYPSAQTFTEETPRFSTHSDRTVVHLQPGEYSVLVINETFTDLENIRFRRTESYDKIEAYIPTDGGEQQLYKSPVYASPEILVVDTLSSFIVKHGVTNKAAQVFTLRKAVATAKVVLYIKGIQYIRSVTSSISGFSEGHLLASRKNNTTSINHRVENLKMSYNKELIGNGIITGSFNTFGLSSNDGQTNRLIFDALLIDGKTKVHEEIDISDLIKINKSEFDISIDIELGSKNNPFIEIPKVEAEEGTSPFDPEVDDWDENETIDIPLL